MTLIPKLEMFCNDEGTVFLEVNLKSLKIGDMIQSLSDVQDVHMSAEGSIYPLKGSIDKEHWFGTAYWTHLANVKNNTLHVYLPNEILKFDCGPTYWEHLVSEVKEDAV